jgi:hypothetical protein
MNRRRFAERKHVLDQLQNAIAREQNAQVRRMLAVVRREVIRDTVALETARDILRRVADDERKLREWVIA